MRHLVDSSFNCGIDDRLSGQNLLQWPISEEGGNSIRTVCTGRAVQPDLDREQLAGAAVARGSCAFALEESCSAKADEAICCQPA